MRYTKKDAEVVWHGWLNMDVYLNNMFNVINKGKGISVKNNKRKKMIDGISSMINCNIGYGNERVINAITNELKNLSASSLLLNTNEASIELARVLIKLTYDKYGHVFYTNSGSESIDTAIKMARQYFFNQGKSKKNKILSLKGAYHGCTYGALSAGGIDYYKRASGELLSGFINIPVPDIFEKEPDKSEKDYIKDYLRIFEETIEREKPGEIAAFIFEPIQLSNVVNILSKEYLAEINRICKEHNILIIADEVATGFGRTGTMFSMEKHGFWPDILAVAKGITSGYIPMGAVLVTSEIYKAFLGKTSENKEFSHGFSTGGNAVACAAALENIKVIEEESLVENSREKGEYLCKMLKELEKTPYIDEVKGDGLMIGIRLNEKKILEKFKGEDLHATIVLGCILLSKGLITYPDSDICLVIAPPLIINETECEFIYNKIKEGLELINEI